MNAVRRYLDARQRARIVVAEAASVEALLDGDYRDIHPALCNGTIVRIVAEDDRYAHARHPHVPGVVFLVPHAHTVRLDTATATRPYDHEREGL